MERGLPVQILTCMQSTQYIEMTGEVPRIPIGKLQIIQKQKNIEQESSQRVKFIGT